MSVQLRRNIPLASHILWLLFDPGNSFLIFNILRLLNRNHTVTLRYTARPLKTSRKKWTMAHVHLLWLNRRSLHRHCLHVRPLILLYIRKRDRRVSVAAGQRQAEASVNSTLPSTLHITCVHLPNAKDEARGQSVHGDIFQDEQQVCSGSFCHNLSGDNQ